MPRPCEIVIEIDGVARTHHWIAAKVGVTPNCIKQRLDKVGEENISLVMDNGYWGKRKRRDPVEFEYSGGTITAPEIAKIAGRSVTMVREYLRNGYTPDEIIYNAENDIKMATRKGQACKGIGRGTVNSEWGNLGCKPRNENLKKIPKPTKFDKLFGYEPDMGQRCAI